MPWKALKEIGEVLYYAATFNPRRWTEDTGMALSKDELLQAVADLFVLLHQRQVSFVLVGGIALLRYVEGRNTQDLDLLLAVEDLEKVPEIALTYQDVYFGRGMYRGVQVGLLFTTNSLFRHVQEKHVQREQFLGVEVPVATVEGLLLLKLYALPSLYRQGDFGRVSLYENDIAMLLYAYRPDVERLLEELRKHLSEGEQAALQEIVQEIQARIERFRQNRGDKPR